ncbi:DUF1232 domain-containing protein [Candidatus Peribacteria bacterium]|nr:DUF1232 domain-containing protein [Candidatus Peribacteria bacterium]
MRPAARTWQKKLRILWLAFIDRRTPIVAKLLVLLALFYGLSPIDAIPDFLPFIGQLDDLGLLIFAIMTFLSMTQSVRQNLERTDVIDVQKYK